MTNDIKDKIKVVCKYKNCPGKPLFNCINTLNYVACGISKTGRYVDWTFYLINAKYLIEIKDDG